MPSNIKYPQNYWV